MKMQAVSAALVLRYLVFSYVINANRCTEASSYIIHAPAPYANPSPPIPRNAKCPTPNLYPTISQTKCK